VSEATTLRNRRKWQALVVVTLLIVMAVDLYRGWHYGAFDSDPCTTYNFLTFQHKAFDCIK
jgi:hypothetical protein